MHDTCCPLTSELLFRAQNYSLDALATTPIAELWEIDPQPAHIILEQLETLLNSDALSAADKLKLGYLAAYSWPLHYHPNTEQTVLRAKAQINSNDVEASLMLWGILASYYLRKNQISLALEQLTLAYGWATRHAKISDLNSIMYWTCLTFSRLDRPEDFYHYASVSLALAERSSHVGRQQTAKFAQANSLLRMKDLDSCQEILVDLQQKTLSGTCAITSINQIGVVNGMAQLALATGNTKQAEKQLHLSHEMQQCGYGELVSARTQVLKCRLELSKYNKSKAHSEFEHLQALRRPGDSELDKQLSQEFDLLQKNFESASPDKTIKPINCAQDSDVAMLKRSLNHCIYTLSTRADGPPLFRVHTHA